MIDQEKKALAPSKPAVGNRTAFIPRLRVFTPESSLLGEIFSSQLQEYFQANRAPAMKLVIDFIHVERITQAALGALIDLKKEMAEIGGKLRLVNIRPEILETFTVTQLDKKFIILPALSEAMSSLGGITKK